MSDIIPISATTLSDKSWKKVPNFGFAIKEISCALGLQEIPRVVADMPVGFVKSASGFSIIGILGLQSNRNLFVGNTGRWHGRYIPALFRAYPFLLARNESLEDQLVFCVNQASGLVAENNENVPFFDSSGELSTELKEILPFLEDLHSNTFAAQKMSALFNDHNLLIPWDLNFELAGETQHVQGLFCIDEAALNKLPDADYLALRDCGALLIAHCQLLSMQHVSDLIQRMHLLTKPESPDIPDELGFGVPVSDGNISFDGF